MRTDDFGTVKDGAKVCLYTIKNKNDMAVSVTNFGAALVKVLVPDKDGNLTDVVLGYDDAAGYEKGTASFGASVGRNANRIGGASLEIQNVKYDLAKNDNGNNLHSGPDYYNKRIWETEECKEDCVTFLLHSPDKDQGYPGSLDMRVTYELTQENELKIYYHAVPDKDTIINMTNHSYFNLDGHKEGSVLKHKVEIDADYFTRADAESIPTGELTPVAGTPMDFRIPKELGLEIDADYEAVKLGLGYDHNWVLKTNGKFVKVAKAEGSHSGIVMEVRTDLPGIQMYTANFLQDEQGKDGAVYPKRSAVCFETQYFPDAVHHDNFASPICEAGEIYDTVTSYKFSLR